MISPPAERALRRIIEGDCPTPKDDELLRPLCGLGLLAPSKSAEAIAPCIAIIPERSALDALDTGPRAPTVVRPLFAFLRARSVLHRQGLESALAQVKRTRSCPRSAASADEVSREVVAFATLRTWLGPLDRCLPLSLALARRCAPHDPDVRLVFGVKLRPFRAHAWVQHGDTVLNDRVDNVRVFTPVLVI